MPILQHALQELWQRRRVRWLRTEEYRAIGGIQQAIAHTADGIYAQSSQDDKERLRNIFVRLTRLDQDGGAEQRDTRQRVSMAELVPAGSDPAGTRELVRRLANTRLLVTSVNPTTGDEQVEVAHEALIRSWPRLRIWLTEDRAGLRMLDTIRQRVRDWEASNHDEGLLLRGSQLDRAEETAGQPRFALNDQERAFLDASLGLRESERLKAEAALAEKEAARQRELEAAQQLATAAEARQQAEEVARHEAEQRAETEKQGREQLRRRAFILAGVAAVAIAALIAAAVLGVQSQRNATKAEK